MSANPIDDVLNSDFWSMLLGDDRLDEHSRRTVRELRQTENIEGGCARILGFLPELVDAQMNAETLRSSSEGNQDIARPVVVDRSVETVFGAKFNYDVTELDRTGRWHVGIEAIFPDDEDITDDMTVIRADDGSPYYLFFPSG